MLYVDSKHMDSMIHGGKMQTEATAAIWITNTGLESSRTALSFDELGDMLLNMGRLAEQLSKFEPPAANPSVNQDAPKGGHRLPNSPCHARRSRVLARRVSPFIS